MAAQAQAMKIESGTKNSRGAQNTYSNHIPIAPAVLCPLPIKSGGTAVDAAVSVNGSGVAIVTGVTVLAGTNTLELPPKRERTELNKTQLARLSNEGFLGGIARELAGMTLQFPIRYWIVDKSGSMWENDGCLLRVLKGLTQVFPCTQWVEIQGTVDYHAKTATLMETWTTFWLLNDPGCCIGPQEFSIAKYGNKNLPSSNSLMKDLQIAETVMRNSEPRGATPLTKHVIEITAQIPSIAEELENCGQKVVLVVATDGLPSDQTDNSTYVTQKAFIQAFNSLLDLPIWLVIQLCTNDKDVVNFYKELDQRLEIELEVLVDLFEESKEVSEHNPWLNYGLLLHCCREMGYHHRIFDLLDKRSLNQDEVKQLLEILFGKD